MIDEFISEAANTYVSVQIDRAAKKHRWVRILQIGVTIVAIMVLAMLVYILARYS